jgi:EmrB/QacA subfamily drug resistance transporter
MIESTQKQVEIPGTAYRNKYLVLVIILIGLLMAVLDSLMMNQAMPTVTKHFGVSLGQSQWAVTGYLLAMTGLFIFFGKVSERTGKAKMFMAGWAVFTFGSLACALSGSLEQLIAFRVVQGIGSSMVSGVAGAIIFQAFPPEERGRAMGYLMVVAAAGSILGPGLGGFIVDRLGWQYIFFVNVPIGAVMLAIALKHLKVPEVTTDRLEMDWIGAGTLFLALVSLLIFCGELTKGLYVTTALLACGFVFAVSTIAFVLRESRSAKPLLDLSIFKNKRFALPVLSMVLVYLATSIAELLGPFYFQGVMGYSPSQVGMVFMVVPVFLMFAAPAGGMLYDKHHWKYSVAPGLLIAATGFFLLAYGYTAASFWPIILAFAVWGIGTGLYMGPNSAEMMGALPMEKTAVASSVSSTGMSLGMSLGVSIASLLLTLMLSNSGYDGVIFLAGESLLANSIGTIIVVPGILCLIAAAASVLRNA